MFNWKNTLTIIGFIGSLISIPLFFRIDAISIWNATDNMSGRTVFLLISLTVLGVGLLLKWLDRKTTPRNAARKIRGWLDTFNITHRVMPWNDWHFRYDATVRGVIVYIGRPKEFGGRYVMLQVRQTGVPSEHKEAYKALPPSQKSQFYAQLGLELSRSNLAFSANDDLSDISITRLFPITKELTESGFVQSLNQISHSTVLVWNTITMRFSENPKLKTLSEVKLPSSASDTEVSPQSQA